MKTNDHTDVTIPEQRRPPRLLSIVHVDQTECAAHISDQLPPHRRSDATLLVACAQGATEAALVADPGQWERVAIASLTERHWAEGTYVGAELVGLVRELEGDTPSDFVCVSHAATTTTAFAIAARLAFDLKRPFVDEVHQLDLETQPAEARTGGEPGPVEIARGSVVAFAPATHRMPVIDLRDRTGQPAKEHS